MFKHTRGREPVVRCTALSAADLSALLPLALQAHTAYKFAALSPPRPSSELWSHYFQAALPQQFDCVIHVDTTSAVQPLDDVPTGRGRQAAGGLLGKGKAGMEQDLPESYPAGATT
jgi:hypothetical protein